tara:strand:- start:777 stop:1244 length:468 start_codon:yes stop_codon:yes gene_type:complete
MTVRHGVARLNNTHSEDIEMTVKYDDQLQAPWGEGYWQGQDQPVPCPANNTEGSYVQRFKWEPGNHTRYDLVYSCRITPDAMEGYRREYLLAYLNPLFDYATCMLVEGPGCAEYIHYSYVMEKMGVNEADAVGLLGFLERMGHRVGYPQPVAVGE